MENDKSIHPKTQENTMPQDNERELGEQPINKLLEGLQLENADLVMASTEQLTFKMVAKARRGRYLTMNVRLKVLRCPGRQLQG